MKKWIQLDLFYSFCCVGFFAIILVMEKFVTLKKVKRKRKHGFLVRMKTHGGQKVIKKRRSKKRAKLSI